MSTDAQFKQFCDITLQQFIEKSKYLTIKVVGTIRTLFKHNKFIVEVFAQRKLIIRAFKRYNQFEALHQLIEMKYKNYKLEEMPSKFQIFGKEQTRKQYFQKMLQKIIKDHEHVNAKLQRLQETKRRMLSIVYLFLTAENEEQKEQKKKQRKVSDDLVDSTSSKKSQNKEKMSKTEFVTSMAEKNELNSLEQLSKKISEYSEKANEYKFEQKFFKESKTQRKHRMSCDLQKFQAMEQIQENRPRCNSVEKQFVSSVNQVIITENEFDIKFQNEAEWKRRYIFIKDSQLELFKNKLDNNFKTKIQLFRITVEFWRRNENLIDHFCEKMEFNVTRTFNQNPQILTLYHEHDHQKIMIRKPLKQGEDPAFNKKILSELKDKFISASRISPIEPNYSGVFNPIGKLFIFLHKIKLSWKKASDNETIQIKIKTGALSYDARPIVYGQQISLKQAFLIPISSSFEIIKFQCLTVKDEGFVKDNIEGKTMGSFSFTMTELLTKPCGFLINKVMLKLETEESRAQKYETYLQVSIQNFSDFSSVYSQSFANEHDGKPLKPLSGFDDIGELSLTVDRVLRILGTIASLIQTFWRNVYLFKYPRMGYCFFALLLINALFFQINDIVKQFLIILMLAILYQQHYIRLIIDYILDKHVFTHIHPDFKKPMILSTSQVKYLKWSNQLKYIAEDYVMIDGRLQKKSDKVKTLFEFEIHGNKFYVRQEEQSFFEKFKEAKKVIELVHKMIDTVANTIEKVGNLLSWADPKRTIFFLMLILVFSGVASGLFVRAIISLFCLHRFYKGTYFYRHKHYHNNRRFAVFCFNYIIRKSFPNLIAVKKQQQTFEEMEETVSHVVFPIHDEISAKKLKLEMDEIMGVYLDTQAIANWAIKKNYLKIGILIDFVQTCQSRLKLKWISGPEGISNQFQELREQTKQIPVIDVWLQSLVINFISNIPSQLYTTFWNSQNSVTNMRKIKTIAKIQEKTKSLQESSQKKQLMQQINTESFMSSGSKNSVDSGKMKTKKE